jgi:hypothetical protein
MKIRKITVQDYLINQTPNNQSLHENQKNHSSEAVKINYSYKALIEHQSS